MQIFSRFFACLAFVIFFSSHPFAYAESFDLDKDGKQLQKRILKEVNTVWNVNREFLIRALYARAVELGARVHTDCPVESVNEDGSVVFPRARLDTGGVWAGCPAKRVRDVSPGELATSAERTDRTSTCQRPSRTCFACSNICSYRRLAST